MLRKNFSECVANTFSLVITRCCAPNRGIFWRTSNLWKYLQSVFLYRCYCVKTTRHPRARSYFLFIFYWMNKSKLIIPKQRRAASVSSGMFRKLQSCDWCSCCHLVPETHQRTWSGAAAGCTFTGRETFFSTFFSEELVSHILRVYFCMGTAKVGGR